MWTDTIGISVGNWRLGVRTDSTRLRRRLVDLLDAYLIDTIHPLPSNFGITVPRGIVRRAPGHLFLGGEVVCSSAKIETVVHQLSVALASLTPVDPPLLLTAHRVFVKDGRAVLVKMERSDPADDRESGPSRILELPFWQTAVDAQSRTIVAPRPLTGLRWVESGFRPPPPLPQAWSIVGVVSSASATTSPSGSADGEGGKFVTGELIRSLVPKENVVAASTPAEMRGALLRLLEGDDRE